MSRRKGGRTRILSSEYLKKHVARAMVGVSRMSWTIVVTILEHDFHMEAREIAIEPIGTGEIPSTSNNAFDRYRAH